MSKIKLLACLAAGLLAVMPCRAAAAEKYIQNTTYDAYAAACEQAIRMYPGYERLLVKTDGSVEMAAFSAETVVCGPENHFMLCCTDSLSAEAALTALNGTAGVLYAEPDALESLNSTENAQTQRSASADTAGHSWGVTHIGADKYAEYLLARKTPESVKIAVVDSGVMLSHAYFQNVSLIPGHDYVDGDENPNDQHGHGTKVCGVLLDCMGNLPVEILVIRTMDASGNGYVSNITAAIRSAADQGAKIINLSLGGKHAASNAKEDAIAYAMSKGAMVVVASGNHGTSIEAFEGCPAHVEGAVVVSAIGEDETFASYSDCGPTVDFAAPGSSVSVPDLQGGFSTASGTSLAAPHVTALAAILWEMNPGYTADQIETLLRRSARDLGAEGKDDNYGYGIPDLRELLGYYHITYGGEGDHFPEQQKEVRMVKATISEIQPDRPGYTFLGWNTEPNASAASYLPGQQLTASADMTLYAVWKSSDLVLTKQPENAAAVSGQVASFETEAPGSNLTYSWQKSFDGVIWQRMAASNAGTAQVSFVTKTTMDGMRIRCVVQNEKGAKIYSDTVTLTVAPSFTVTEQPEDQRAGLGKQVSFGIGTAGAAVRYQWQKSYDGGMSWQNMAADTAKDRTVSFKASKNTDGMRVRCVMTDEAGSKIISREALLTVAAKPVFTVSPDDTWAAEGSSISLQALAEGEDIRYQWQKCYNGITWQNMAAETAKSDTVRFKATKSTDGMQVRCVASDRYGNSTIGDPITVSLIWKPVITVQPTDCTVPQGKEASFNVQAAGDDLRYTWQKSYDGVKWQGMMAESANTDSLHFTATKSTDNMQVRCVITNGAGTKVYSACAAVHFSSVK